MVLTKRVQKIRRSRDKTGPTYGEPLEDLIRFFHAIDIGYREAFDRVPGRKLRVSGAEPLGHRFRRMYEFCAVLCLQAGAKDDTRKRTMKKPDTSLR